MPELRREFVRVPAQDFKPSVVFTAPLSLPPEATDVTAPANREAMPLPPLHMVLQPHAQMPDLKVSDEPVLQAHGQVVEVSDDPVLAPQGKLVEEPASGPVTKATEPTAESASVDSDSSMHPWLLMQVIEDLQGDALTKLPVAAWEGIKYPLTGDAHFCGRRFKEDICLFEEDVSTSNFHGIFQRQENGSYTFMDRSSNGTAIDGIQVPKNKDTPLKNGNVLTLGGFTRITYFEPVHQPKDLTTEPDQMLTATA
jgi:hypothetical protein